MESEGRTLSICTIEEATAYEILDSRGNPTVRVCLKACGKKACASVPSGASTGKHEAFELRDGGKRLGGKGVTKAASNVKEIAAQVLAGEPLTSLRRIDSLLIAADGTENKSKLGANAILGVSMAAARLISEINGFPLYAVLGGIMRRRLPTPLLNIINGGKHAGNSMSFQEFLLIPYGFGRFSEALWASSEVYHSLKGLIKDRYGSIYTSVGDEGGFAPPITDPREALSLLRDAVEASGYRAGEDFAFGIDAAASSFYDQRKNAYAVSGKELSPEELLELYLNLMDSFPLKLIEDPFQEEDFDWFRTITSEAKKRGVVIVGDDLLTTNIKRLEIAIAKGSVSAVLIKLNQIGTVSETVDFSRLAQDRGLKRIVSHRSGDTEDPFIADLSVAIESEGIKTGAPARAERTSKYNRLLEIELELGTEAKYAGRDLFL